MSNIRNYKINTVYEKFSCTNYKNESFNYLRVLRDNEIDINSIQSDKGKLKKLELGFAPAVMIDESFEDFKNYQNYMKYK